MIRTSRKSMMEEIQINVTPMIDLMIFLIVFFLTATTFTQIEREQEVLLPSTRGSGSLSRALDNNLIINVKKDGTLVVAGRRYGEKDLLAVIAARNSSSNKTLRVKVRGDARAFHGDVARVLALVEEAGVTRSYIDTKVEKLEP